MGGRRFLQEGATTKWGDGLGWEALGIIGGPGGLRGATRVSGPAPDLGFLGEKQPQW